MINYLGAFLLIAGATMVVTEHRIKLDASGEVLENDKRRKRIAKMDGTTITDGKGLTVFEKGKTEPQVNGNDFHKNHKIVHQDDEIYNPTPLGSQDVENDCNWMCLQIKLDAAKHQKAVASKRQVENEKKAKVARAAQAHKDTEVKAAAASGALTTVAAMTKFKTPVTAAVSFASVGADTLHDGINLKNLGLTKQDVQIGGGLVSTPVGEGLGAFNDTVSSGTVVIEEPINNFVDSFIPEGSVGDVARGVTKGIIEAPIEIASDVVKAPAAVARLAVDAGATIGQGIQELFIPPPHSRSKKHKKLPCAPWWDAASVASGHARYCV